MPNCGAPIRAWAPPYQPSRVQRPPKCDWHLRFGIAAEMLPVHALSLINKEAARAIKWTGIYVLA